jgi:hypothetical protein
MGTLNINKLKGGEGKEKYCIEVSNRFATLGDLDAKTEINGAWETIRENIIISAKESLEYSQLKMNKLWFDGGFSKLLHQRKPNCSGYMI